MASSRRLSYTTRSHDSMKSPAPLSTRSTDQQPASTTRNAAGTTPGSALKGASVAFQAPPPTPKPLINTYSGTNGALAAATRAGLGQQKNVGKTAITAFEIQTPKTPLDAFPKRTTSCTIDGLRLSREASSSRQQSPSYIAATLAAARSTPTPVNGPISVGKGMQRARQASQDHKDESSIPATNSLVQLFESKYGSQEVKKVVKTPSSEPLERPPPRQIVSPQPIRPHLAWRLSSQTLNGTAKLHENRNLEPRPNLGKDEPIPRPASATAAATAFAASLAQSNETPKAVPKPPPTRGTRRPTSIKVPSKEDDEDASPSATDSFSTSTYTSARDVLSRTDTRNLSQAISPQPLKPYLPPSHPPKFAQPAKRFSPPPTKPPILRRASARPYTSVPAPSRLSPQLTADSLANAMVASSLASSLASSRATSPSKQIPPLPRRHSRPLSLFLPSHQHFPSRTPSPNKVTGMRHTLRKEISSEEEKEERERKRHHHILKKHPNKHAEGDRKRWRDSITERERKRYEGVWATNRGLLLPLSLLRPSPNQTPSSASTSFAAIKQAELNLLDCVHALIVKDIWTRSQLALPTLAEIWELVDGLGEGRLRREEFVVGMWLVDQCLKGRKLPVRVGESVWESVRVLRGVRVSGRWG